MSRSESGAVGSCGNAGHMETRSDFLQLQKLLHDNQKVMEERFAKLEECLSQEQGRISKLEESVRRAVDGVMPKADELLARHDTLQPLREVDPRLVPVSASSAPNDGRSLTANVASTIVVPQQNFKRGAQAVAGGNNKRAKGSASTNPTECALVTDGGATVPPAPSSEGAAPASRPSAPPPAAASGATNPAASLHEAAERGDAAAVQLFLADGAQVDARDKGGNTALHIAASSGRTEIVDILITNGAAVNRRGLRSRTPLHCALLTGVKKERLHIVKYLLEKNASPFTVDKSNEYPLLLSSKKGYGDVVEKMLQMAGTGDTNLLKRSLCAAGSADVVWSFADEAHDLVLGPAGGEALVEAARDGRLEVMEALLQVGVNAKESLEMALHTAAEKGHRGCIVALLDAGVDVNARDIKTKHTALSLAAMYGYAECVEVLLQRGAKKNQLTEEVLVNAARGGPLDVLKILLRGGAGAKESREEALRAAAEGGRRGCIVALLDAGVDVNAGDNYNWTALHWAALKGHAECVKELLQRGAKKELKDNVGKTALSLAHEKNQAACIDILQN